jgi:hypothetical protein
MLTSLRGKLTFIFLAITVSAVTISTGNSKYIHTRVAVERAKEMAQDNLKLIASELQSMNQWIIRDLFAIRDLPQFKDLVDSRHTSAYGMNLRTIHDGMLISVSDADRFYIWKSSVGATFS